MLGLHISAIVMQRSEEGRETGEAFVRLASMDDVDKALERDKKEIQHRYVPLKIQYRQNVYYS